MFLLQLIAEFMGKEHKPSTALFTTVSSACHEEKKFPCSGIWGAAEP